MDVRYEKLFSIDFVHHYHQSNRYDGFGIVTDNNTDQLMKAFGLLLKKRNGGFIVLFKEAENRPSLLKNLSQKVKLTFYLTLSDGVFFNYSDLIPDSLDKPFYLSNLTPDSQHRDVVLHHDEPATEKDRIQKVGFKQDLLKYIDNAINHITVQTRFDETIFEGNWDDFQNNVSDDELRSHGFLKIDFNQKGTPQSFHFSPVGLNQIFALVDIFIGPDDSTMSFEEVVNSEYTFIIGARSVIWKYFIVSNGQNNYTDLKILNGRDRLPTTEALEVNLPDGSPAYKIESLKPLKLQERYSSYLELEMTKNSNTTINQRIKQRLSLPAPDVGRVKVTKTNDIYNAYSEMYVYF